MTAVCPGELVGSLSTHTPGSGTHVYESNIYASIAGLVLSTNSTSSVTTSTKPSTASVTRPTVSVSQTSSISSLSSPLTQRPLLPSVGSIILGRVLRVQQRQLTLSILSVVPNTTSPSPQPQIYTSITTPDLQSTALLRREDVRSYEKDKIVMNDSYRTGDIVRAVVISLGDERNYYVSTAGNEFGVVIARSEGGNEVEGEQGNPMVPVSWREMRDNVSGKVELRKVAKPV